MQNYSFSDKKIKLLRLVIVLSFIYSTSLAIFDFFGITEYIEYRFPLMSVYAVFNLILYYYIEKSSKYNKRILNIVLILALIVFTTTIIIYPKSEIRFMWYFFTIVIAYYIGDKKIGNITAIASLFIIIFSNTIFNLGFNSTTITSIAIGILFISQLSNYFVGILNDNEKKLALAKLEIEESHKHTRESIEYAALIQSALIPDKSLLNRYFEESFVYWAPKDTVGGDIWLFDELRHDDECLLFVIDCTGHGVPGAFVTMIVKSIEREIVSNIMNDPNMQVSPGKIMGYFNKTMKELLRQEDEKSLSNAGWDGAIIYYNKRDNIIKFAGANSQLFYLDYKSGLQTIKGNRYSVGYKKCEMNYKYKETVLNVNPGMRFYCTTDGYIDQNGGEKDFPFGRKRFKSLIESNYFKSMNEQKEIFLNTLEEYQSQINDNDRNDDITVIGFKI